MRTVRRTVRAVRFVISLFFCYGILGVKIREMDSCRFAIFLHVTAFLNVDWSYLTSHWSIAATCMNKVATLSHDYFCFCYGILRVKIIDVLLLH